jgi:RNA-binding protein 39
VEIRDDVIEECNKHGGVLHVYVDKASPQGNVYVKCPSIATAVAAVNSLHGRWFAGKFRCGLHRSVVSQVLLEYFKHIHNLPCSRYWK